MIKDLFLYMLGVCVGMFAAYKFIDYNPDTCPENQICYVQHGDVVTPEYILQGAVVHVRWVDQSELPDGIDGFAEYELDPDGRPMSWCRITVPLPTQVLGDPVMDTIGHEFMHCVTGDFHP
jgi:hypothetical protein